MNSIPYTIQNEDSSNIIMIPEYGPLDQNNKTEILKALLQDYKTNKKTTKTTILRPLVAILWYC